MTGGALERVLARVKKVRREGDQWEGLCPAHDDTDPSLSITAENGKVLLCCHAGCLTEDVVAALGLSMADLFDEERPRRESGQGREIVATYDYVDETGRLLFQTVRFRPKGFAQRRPDGADGWLWDLKGVRRVLYRLPKVLAAAARGQRVYKPEGEKDVHALEKLGLTATTNAGGAGKWLKAYSESLRGAHVVILPDNDPAGGKHGEKVAASLQGMAASVKMVHLAGLPEGGDVSDWLAAGHTREELEALVEAAPEWRPEEVAPGRFPLTDLGNAERLIAAHGANLRFHVNAGMWLDWTGAVWANDEAGEAHRLAAQTVRALHREAEAAESEAAREALFKHITKSESAPRLSAMLDLAGNGSVPGVRVTVAELDCDPWLLNVVNGTLDLRTGKLRCHDPQDFITKLAPVVYDPTAECPRWLQFLREVFQGDDELLGYSQRLGGYMLSGSAQEQCVNFLVGKGSNGKLVFTETWQRMLGDYAKETPFTTFLERRDTATNDLAALVGARMVTASEGAAHKVFNEALLKQLSGGDPVTCRFLHKEFFTYTPTYKILFATNEVPRIQSQTYAVKRRVRIIPFRQTFYALEDGKEPVRDERLRDKLRAELPGILAWAVQGCLTWQKEGLRPPEVVMQETAALFEAMDPLADFLEEECVLHSRALVETGVLWRAYRGRCEREERPNAFKSPTWFTRSLTQRDGVDLIRRSGGRYLTGVGLRAEESPKLTEMSDHAHA